MSNDKITLVNPEDILLDRFVRGDALLEITANDLNVIGMYLLSIGKPENKTCLKLLVSNYDTLYKRLMERDGMLVSSSKVIKRLAEIESRLEEVILQLVECEYSQDEIVDLIKGVLK